MNTPDGWVSDGDWRRLSGFPLSPELTLYSSANTLAAVAVDMKGRVQGFNSLAAKSFAAHFGVGSDPTDPAGEAIVVGEHGNLLSSNDFVHLEPVPVFIFGLINRLGATLWLAAESKPLYRPETGEQYGTAFLVVSIPLNSHGEPASMHPLHIAAHQVATRLRDRRSQDYLTTHDLDNSILYASRGVQRVLGYDPIALVGLDAYDLIHPDDVERVRVVENNLGEDAIDLHFRIRRVDGNWITVHAFAHRRPALGGDRIIVLTHPQIQCTAMEPLYQHVLDRSQDAVLILDSKRRIVRVNEEFLDITGYEQGDILYRTATFLGHEDPIVNDRFESMMSLLFSGAATQFDALAQVSLADGSRITTTCDLASIVDDHGLVRYVTVTCDLRSGASKSADPESMDLDEIIRRDSRFRVALDSTLEGFALVTRDGYILEANRSLGRIIGIPPNELPGRRIWAIAAGTNDERDRIRDLARTLSETLADTDPETPIPPGVLISEVDGQRYLIHDFSATRATGAPFRCRISVTEVHDPHAPDLGYVVNVVDVTSAYAAQQQLEYQSTHDLLTQTANRDGVLKKIDNLIHSTGGCVVLFCDIDGFAEINNSIGNEAGDEVLRVVASRMVEAVGDAERVGRIGSDEYIVLLPLSSRNEIDRIIRHLLEVVSRDMYVNSRRLNVTLSVGSAEGRAGDVPAQLLRDADVALSRVRHKGTSNWAAFDEGMRMEIQRRLSLKEEMVRGLERDEFMAYFQPIVELETRRIVGFESLVRWRRNGRVVSPAVFLSVAEDTGLIVPIGQRLIAQCADFLAKIPEDLFITFNMAAQQFYNLGALLGPYKKLWPRITLELTESSAFLLSNHSRADLLRVREAGIGLWVDDFGTGFSSIATLRDFPVSGLKLDKSFVAPLGQSDSETSQAYGISDSLCRLASNLSLMAIAEGVETRAQADALQHMGWKYAQGFLLGRPDTSGYWADWVARASTVRVEE